MKNLTTAIQKSIPLLLIYIFAAVPATIMKESGISENLAQKLLPTGVSPYLKYYALFAIFGLSLLLAFFVCTPMIGCLLVSATAPALVAISPTVLIYAALFAWIGALMGMAFSPNNGILRASLEKSNITYKQFIKKTWKLGLIMLAIAFGLVCFWIRFNIK